MRNQKIGELKSALMSIKCPKEIDDKIFKKIHNKSKNLKPALAVISIFLICIFTISIVNAEEIAKKVYNFLITTKSEEDQEGYDIELKDSTVAEINYDADMPECGNPEDSESVECDVTYTKEELEDMLNIKILSNSLFPTDTYKLEYSLKNDGKIAGLSFKLAEELTDDSKINEYKNTNIYRPYVALSTKYKKDFDGTLIQGGTYKYDVYHINSINEDALIMKTAGQSIFLYIITFVHDGLVYQPEILFKGSWEQDPDEIYPKFLEAYTEE